MVGPPSALITAAIIFGIVLNLWHSSFDTLFHSCWWMCFSSSLDVIEWPLILRFGILHRCSMGFRSGDCAGHSRRRTPCFLNYFIVRIALWHDALSCYIILRLFLLPKILRIDGYNAVSSTFKYLVESMRPSHYVHFADTTCCILWVVPVSIGFKRLKKVLNKYWDNFILIL